MLGVIGVACSGKLAGTFKWQTDITFIEIGFFFGRMHAFTIIIIILFFFIFLEKNFDQHQPAGIES